MVKQIIAAGTRNATRTMEEGSPQELRASGQGCQWKDLLLVPTPQSMVHSQA